MADWVYLLLDQLIDAGQAPIAIIFAGALFRAGWEIGGWALRKMGYRVSS